MRLKLELQRAEMLLLLAEPCAGHDIIQAPVSRKHSSIYSLYSLYSCSHAVYSSFVYSLSHQSELNFFPLVSNSKNERTSDSEYDNNI